jgi:hypothetical protein
MPANCGDRMTIWLSEVNAQHGAPVVIRMRAMSVGPKPRPRGGGEDAAKSSWQSY